MLGNLARATYVGSSDFVWPYSYNKCDSRNRQSQLINACAKVNHYGLESFMGRGSPEIDVLESMQGEAGKLPNTFIQRPYQSASLQIAPGVEIDRPVLGKRPNPVRGLVSFGSTLVHRAFRSQAKQIQGHWYTHLEYSERNISDLNPFFYGVTLIHKPKSLTYQSDALSANRQLNTTHYSMQHTYRVEWEPPAHDGSGGYIKWFTDGELIYGLQGSSLDIMQSEIPSEPMYLIMNTAVSSSWGFPMPCPDNCACDCFECGNPACACALPTGYCENFPAAFEIDYVRVYQAVNESRHVLGCSPENRPTDLFIKGHEKLFTAEGQKRPLEPVRCGGGSCTKNSDCGKQREMGTCSSDGSCICSTNFTGPNCLAHNGYYDVDTSTPIKPFSRKLPIDNRERDLRSIPLTLDLFSAVSEMIIPKSLAIVVILLAVGFLISMCGAIRANSKLPKYQKLSNGNALAPNGLPTIISYQDSAAVHYALAPKQQKKDVTYCVIDGRLVDNR